MIGHAYPGLVICTCWVKSSVMCQRVCICNMYVMSLDSSCTVYCNGLNLCSDDEELLALCGGGPITQALAQNSCEVHGPVLTAFLTSCDTMTHGEDGIGTTDFASGSGGDIEAGKPRTNLSYASLRVCGQEIQGLNLIVM